MEHFSEQSWADVARGISASAKAQGIQAHLAASCLNCKQSHDFWTRLYSVAQAETTYAPPENLVRMMKLEFAAKYAAQPAKAEKWSLATVLFDSVLQPLPAGVRSSAATARQMVFEAEGLTVDLRFDRMANVRAISVVGQVLDKAVPRQPLAGSPIVLWTEDGQLLATTEANEFGEFQLEFIPQNDLRLTAKVGHRKVQIPLANWQ